MALAARPSTRPDARGVDRWFRRTRRSADAPVELGTTVAGTLLLLYLAGLALFDQTFARLGVPGVPVYPSELVLAVGVFFLVTRRHPFRGVRTGRWMAPVLLALFLAWGLVKLLTSLHYPVLAVVRDSALVYYALFAVVAIGLSGYDRRFSPKGLLEAYGRFVPWLMVIAPIRAVVVVVYAQEGPTLPGSDIFILSGHRLLGTWR